MSTFLPERFSWPQLVVLLCLASSIAPANEAKPERLTFHVDNPQDWTQPTRVLPPAYPKSQLEAGATGHVDVRTSITALGQFKSLVSMTSQPPNPDFEQAVAEAVRHWHFKESIDADCAPIESEGISRVWFDIKNGEPKVSVSHLPRQTPQRASRTKLLKLDTSALTKALSKGMPRPDFEKSMEGLVYGRLLVDAVTGDTKDVTITRVLAEPGFEGNFAEAFKAGFRTARFEVSWQQREGLVTVCRSFRISLNP
jgi:TonB family protein